MWEVEWEAGEMDAERLEVLVGELRIVGTDQQHVEVKSDVGKSILPTLSAFSNGNGGLILVGLSEAAGFVPVEGFSARQARDMLISRCSQLTPIVRPVVDIVSFEGTEVLAAEVRELPAHDKPCYITERGRYSGSFLRTGDGDARLQTYEVDRLIEEHSQPVWDQEPVPDASLTDLEGESLNEFLSVQRTRRPKTFRDGDDVALRRLRVQSGENPTLGALLALGDYPQQFFPRLCVTFAHFPGTDRGSVGKGLRLIDTAQITGSIVDMVEATVSAVQRNMRTGASIDGALRTEVPDYPLVAVREAIVNALMHRDYSPHSRGAQVQVNLFVDRLEIINPGGLFGTATMRALGTPGASSSRNASLSVMLEDIRRPGGGMVADNRGTGIAVMQSEVARAMMPPVEFRDDLASFTAVFRRRRVMPDERYGTALERVLASLESKETVSTSELMAETQLSRTAVQNAVNRLIVDGRVEATEPPRSPRQRYRLTTLP